MGHNSYICSLVEPAMCSSTVVAVKPVAGWAFFDLFHLSCGAIYKRIAR